MANTAAASVEETMEPINRDSMKVKSVIQLMKNPKAMAVIKTPRVESKIPLPKIGFTSSHLVSNPPENMIKTSAILPMNCAMVESSKYIPPIPSEPANIPKTRNKINEGIPNLDETLLNSILIKSKKDAIKIDCSVNMFNCILTDYQFIIKWLLILYLLQILYYHEKISNKIFYNNIYIKIYLTQFITVFHHDK